MGIWRRVHAEPEIMLTFVSFVVGIMHFRATDPDIAVIQMVPDDESLIPEVKEGQNDQGSTEGQESPAVSYSFSIPDAEVC